MLIRHRLARLKNPSDLNKFDELQSTIAYALCMETAGQFRVATLKQKQVLRVEALYHAKKQIAKLQAQLQDSYQPEILFYRAKQGDEHALQLFLKMENSTLLDSPALQLALASYYFNKDKPHSITILHKGLALHRQQDLHSKQHILPEITKTLATLNLQLGNLEQAYLWTMVSKEFDVPVVNDATLQRLHPFDSQQRGKLITDAKKITQEINSGQFDPTRLE